MTKSSYLLTQAWYHHWYWSNLLHLWCQWWISHKLPNTGFPVGGSSSIQYLVMQVGLQFFLTRYVEVHYINVDYLSSDGDTAGVDLLFTDKVAKSNSSSNITQSVKWISLNEMSTVIFKVETDLQEPSRSAGMLSVHVMTNVPPLARSYQDGGCRVAERVVFNSSSTMINYPVSLVCWSLDIYKAQIG